VSRQRRDPSELTFEQAAERYLGRKRGSKADATVREYGYRLNRFRQWADEEGLETVGELHPLDFDDYLASREADEVQPITMQKHFGTIREFVEFLERLGAVDGGLSDAVPDVDVPRGGDVNDEMLDVDEGDALIRYYRGSDEHYGTREHAMLEVIWMVGCRLGAVRGLDLTDFDPRGESLSFHHRPEGDTPLKKGIDGERVVALPTPTVDAIDHYVNIYRPEVRDENGREPLFTSTQGRLAENTVRNTCYRATQPCIRISCPHGKRRDSCEWRQYTKASQCPSSRGPTAIKTGAVTRMLHNTSRDRVRHRANTSQWDNYDHATEEQKMEERDRGTLGDIELGADEDDDQTEDTS